MLVKQLTDGQDVDLVLLVRDREVRTKREGGEYLKLGLADRTGSYWTITFIGYGINLLVVPALAFAGNWQMAAILVIAARSIISNTRSFQRTAFDVINRLSVLLVCTRDMPSVSARCCCVNGNWIVPFLTMPASSART